VAVSEIQKMLLTQHAEAGLKYTYFMLTATGAGIGFAVQKLEGQSLDLPGTLWLQGTALWLLGFLAGCLVLRSEIRMKKFNVYLVQLKDGNHPLQPDTAEELHFGKVLTRNWYDTADRNAQISSRWQFILVIAGTCFVIASRVVQMIGATA
jgi:hypothetical protein